MAGGERRGEILKRQKVKNVNKDGTTYSAPVVPVFWKDNLS